MTDENRRADVRTMIREYTAEHSRSPEAARKALIAEGIYTKDGQLLPKFGGEQRDRKAA